MKKILIVFFTLCALCILPAMAADDSSYSQAQESLSDLGISENDLVKSNVISETNRDAYYKFTTTDGSEYYVNSKTSVIERIDHRFDWKQTQDITLDLNAAEESAIEAVKKYSGEQNRPGLKIVSSKLVDHGDFKEYLIEFREIVNDVTLPNAARISIDPSNGALLSYMSINKLVEVPLKPALFQGDALKIAGDQYPGINIISHEANLEIAYPARDTQRLIYRITITGEPVNDIMYGGFLAIDATDGKVWYNSPFK